MKKTLARGGFAQLNTAVPVSTLTPMTAVLFNSQLTAGAGWRHGRRMLRASYGYTLTDSAHTAQSGLLAGEYNNSSIHTGMQAVTASSAFLF